MSLDTPPADDELLDYPAMRHDPLGVAPEYLAFAHRRPIARVRLPSGAPAWLVTGHELAREALSHPALSADASAAGFPQFRKTTRRLALASQTTTGRANMTFIQMDPPHHDNLRRMLRGWFSHKSVRDMRPRLESIAGGLVDRMVDAGPPADLVAMLSNPFSGMVICQVLGVPTEDLEMFERETRRVMDMRSTHREYVSALKNLIGSMDKLVRGAREAPGDDLVGRLVTDFHQSGELEHEELVSVVRLLLMAGMETTANMIGISLVALLRDRVLYDQLRDDPSLVPTAVEELLRYIVIAQHGMRRQAREDLVLGGELVRGGEGVIVSLSAANRDPAVFDRPDEIDFTRDARKQMSFSHGVHYCLGHILARAELEVALRTVIERLPGLKLAVPFESLEFRDDTVVYGVNELPVSW